MAADKLGQRRCSNHVDSAVKNIVTTLNKLRQDQSN